MKKRAPHKPPRRSEHFYVELAPRDIAFFRFILESCDNLAYFTVVDRFKAVVRVVYAPGWKRQVVETLDGIRQHVPLKIIEPPLVPTRRPTGETA